MERRLPFIRIHLAVFVTHVLQRGQGNPGLAILLATADPKRLPSQDLLGNFRSTLPVLRLGLLLATGDRTRIPSQIQLMDGPSILLPLHPDLLPGAEILDVNSRPHCPISTTRLFIG